MKAYLKERNSTGVRGNLRREIASYRIAFWIVVTCIAVYCWSAVFINAVTF